MEKVYSNFEFGKIPVQDEVISVTWYPMEIGNGGAVGRDVLMVGQQVQREAKTNIP